MTFKDIVVLVPGIGGTDLVKDGRTVWGLTARAIARTLWSRSLDHLTIDEESRAEDLGDGIVPSKLLDDVHVIPGLWKIDGYGELHDLLQSRLVLQPDKNLFTFPYDWRRDNRVSAERLARHVHGWLATWREAGGPADARVVFVAHSMGGLVARYFIECLGGWKSARRLITVGTPYRGSLNALGFLANGFSRGIGPFSIDATGPLRSFASVHQLLPTFECVDGGAGLVKVDALKIGGLDPTKVGDAMAFHAEIDAARTANEKETGYAPYVTSVASWQQPTFQSATATGAGVTLLSSYEGENNGGDGTVPLISAIPQGVEQENAVHVSGLHARLQNEAAVGTLVSGLLHTSQIDFDRFRAGRADAHVAVALDDAYAADEPIEIAATVVNAHEQKLLAVATDTASGESRQTTLWPGDAVFRGSLALSPGAWRIAVSGPTAGRVEDVVLVTGRGDPAAGAENPDG